MVIKKYIAATENEAIALAKAELGEDVTIMNIKENNPKGLSKLFKKSSVEVTAAVDDVKKEQVRPESKTAAADFEKLQQALDAGRFKPASDSKSARIEENKERLVRNNQIIRDNVVDIVSDKIDPNNEIEQKLNTLQDLIEKQMAASVKDEQQKYDKKEDKNKAYLDLIRRQLLDNDVEMSYIEQIIDDIKGSIGSNSSLDNILAGVYQKIVLKIGQPHLIDTQNKKTRFIFFIGPTGVGKTTTIAKIASTMKLSKKVKVALVTSDTYRIAAVEQLRTYANILSIPLKVVYTAEEMENIRDELIDYDLVLIDTAGRSHNNVEQKEDLIKLLGAIPQDEQEVYLVLSSTTKYKDLVRISQTYSEMTKYNLIFTKLDETDTIGNIYNLRVLTSAPLSYATWGQNVPDDIGKFNAQKIAKQLLGGNG
ncbi:MAG: flagellar biosynthesis protein FlhF [Christensenellales bacterium]